MSSAASATPGRPALPISERELVIMLALTQALQALAVDSMLPALGDISRDLGLADPNRRQLIVGLFLLGVGLGSLIPGTLADRFGRKKVVLVCVAAYVVICTAMALAQDFTMMAGLRLVQGLLCAGLAVVPPAIIRDRFDGDRMASLQSLITMIFLVVPMLAPSLGQLVLLFAGWRWIFVFMAVLGAGMFAWLALRLPETLRPEYRQPVSAKAIGRNLATALTTRASIGYVLASSASMAVMWGYVQSCQQLVGEHFGAGRAFPLIFGGMALCMAAANFTNSRIVQRFGARRVGQSALFAYLALAVGQWVLAHRAGETLWQFVPLMTLMMICGGFTGANFSSIALQPFARMAGAASSVQTFIRNVLAGLVAAVIGQAYDGSARPLSTAMVIAGVTALLLVLWSEKGRLFRRVYPAGVPRPAD